MIELSVWSDEVVECELPLSELSIIGDQARSWNELVQDGFDVVPVSSVKRGELDEDIGIGGSFRKGEYPVTKAFEVVTGTLFHRNGSELFKVALLGAIGLVLLRRASGCLEVCSSKSGELLHLIESSLSFEDSIALEMRSSGGGTDFLSDDKILPEGGGTRGNLLILLCGPRMDCECPMFARIA